MSEPSFCFYLTLKSLQIRTETKGQKEIQLDEDMVRQEYIFIGSLSRLTETSQIESDTRPTEEKTEVFGMGQFVSAGIKFNIESLANRIINYVLSHRNIDGGCSFVEENDSNAQDTYYGLAILKLLDSPFPNMDKTIEWLSLFNLGSTYSYCYIGKSLLLCEREPNKLFRKKFESLIFSGRYFGSVDVYIEVDSEFQITQMVLELANLLDLGQPSSTVIDWIMSYKNEDNGFGTHGHSNINSTYYALSSLDLLGIDVNDLERTESFIRNCENPRGGFTVVPHSFAPYMEHTYYGVMALDALGKRCRFQSQSIDFVLGCQNSNGGFARADLGISSFENTFQAVSILKKLELSQ